MATISWAAFVGADPEQVIEVLATCKADAIGDNEGMIQLLVEVHARPRVRLDMKVSAKVGESTDLSSMLELCGRLKKDKVATLLVTPGASQIKVVAILLESLRLKVTHVSSKTGA